MLSTIARKIKLLSPSNLGRCRNCIRTAFIACSFSWFAVWVAERVFPSELGFLPLAIGVTLTMLWVGHVIAFASRTTGAEKNPFGRTFVSRRSLWPLFFRAAASAALVSALGNTALADSPCGGWPDQGLGCGPCQRRNSVGSPCQDCHSCGQGCQGNC
jgi:hypothetical protein